MTVVFGDAAVGHYLNLFPTAAAGVERDLAIVLQMFHVGRAAEAACALRNFALPGCRCIFILGFQSAKDALAVVEHQLSQKLKAYGMTLSELSHGTGTAAARVDSNLVAYAACDPQVSRVSNPANSGQVKRSQF